MSHNRIIVTYDGNTNNIDFTGYSVQNIGNTKDLESFSIRYGVRVGIFPALVDITNRVWRSIDTTVIDAVTKLDTLIQDLKPSDQKVYENNFFDMCKLILTVTGDARSNNTPTPKLSLDELSTIIEGYETTDFNTSVKFSLKLLSLDAALKRYNILWWDDAVYHTIK